jgi:hypothetical protein
MSYGVFTSTIETLAQSTVPTGPLDRRVLDGLSGADYGALISGLRFLGFVDDERRATAQYRQLVAAWKQGPQTYQGTLLDLISPRYDTIIGRVDTEHGTITELEKAFRDAGVAPGQMLTKTIRFYVKFLTEIGVPVSPHITKPRRPSQSRKINGEAKPRRKSNEPPAAPPPPAGGMAAKPTFQVLYELLDPNMGKEEEAAIWTLIRYLRKKETQS